MDTEQQRLLERGVNALEKLAADPVINIEVKPPVCPNCGKYNPHVRVQESEASGPLFEFVIMCQCLACNNVFYAVADTWNCLKTVDDVKLLIEERAGMVQYGDHSREDQRT